MKRNPLNFADSSEKATPSSSSFCQRSHTCGDLRASDADVEVTLYGWLQFKRLTGRFITLRDAYGTTQISLDENSVCHYDEYLYIIVNSKLIVMSKYVFLFSSENITLHFYNNILID